MAPRLRRITPTIVLFALACTIPHGMVLGPAGPQCRAPADIDWISPTEDRDRMLIDRWCATVGEPVLTLQPGGVSSRVASEAPDSVLVVAWNLHIGGADLPRFLREEVGLDCSSDQAAGGPPVVLLLQEVHRDLGALPPVASKSHAPLRIQPTPPPGGRVDVVEEARRCGMSLAYIPSARNGTDSVPELSEDKGNAILSNLPLHDVSAIEVPFEAGRKVAVAATVRLSGGVGVRVVSVHLDVASTLVRTLQTGHATRLRQVLGLYEGMELDAPGAGLTWVLGGDFNTWSGSEAALIRLRELFPDSPEWDGQGTRGPFPTDHVFVKTTSGGGPVVRPNSYRRAEEYYHSDHYARLLWIGH